MRGLSKTFLNDLKTGALCGFLAAVKSDDTLCLEIRDNYINIYYRGGNMFKITPNNSSYEVIFDQNYCKHKNAFSYGNNLSISSKDLNTWQKIPYIKAEMDLWFNEHPKLEREYQQLVLRDNNNSAIANGTDYFISDIEYANSENGSRFDLLGLKWLSKSEERKKADHISLAFIEMKYGDGTLTGSAGLSKHIDDLDKFTTNTLSLQNIYEEIEKVFNQKIELGLIPSIRNQIKINRNINPEFILLIANHKPAKSVLNREINNILVSSGYKNLSSRVDVKIATASFMGYGLYADSMIPIDQF